jgi:hypothetical protein
VRRGNRRARKLGQVAVRQAVIEVSRIAAVGADHDRGLA